MKQLNPVTVSNFSSPSPKWNNSIEQLYYEREKIASGIATIPIRLGIFSLDAKRT